jgi:small subunit ribosomal protein S9
VSEAKPTDTAKQAAPPAGKGEQGEPAVIQVPPPPEGTHYWWGTGRRKTAVARVRIRPGEGKVLINGRQVDEFFTQEQDRQAVAAPLKAARLVGQVDVWANVSGGGHTGQAGAVLLGLARAIRKAAPNAEGILRDRRLLTRDSRMKERKKPGQRGARRRFQFSKR